MPAARLTKETLELIRRLNAAGWTDDLIADVVGVTQPNVCLARKRLGVRAAYRGRTKEAFRRAQQRHFEEGMQPLDGHEPAEPATPLDDAVAAEETCRLLGSLASMGSRPAEVVLLSGRGCSLAAIGRVLGLSRERVRQIRDRALSDMAETKGGKPMGHLEARVVEALDALIAARRRELEGLVTMRRLLGTPAEAAAGAVHGSKTRAIVDALVLGPATSGEVRERIAQAVGAEPSRGGTAATLSHLRKRGIVARDESGRWSLVRREEA